MVTKKQAHNAALTAFASFARDKFAQKTAWGMASRSQTSSMSEREAKRRFADAKKRLKDAPIGSAVRLNSGVYLKKVGKGDYEISSLQ